MQLSPLLLIDVRTAMGVTPSLKCTVGCAKAMLGSAMGEALGVNSHAGNGLRHNNRCHAVSMTGRTTSTFEYNYADVELDYPVET